MRATEATAFTTLTTIRISHHPKNHNFKVIFTPKAIKSRKSHKFLHFCAIEIIYETIIDAITFGNIQLARISIFLIKSVITASIWSYFRLSEIRKASAATRSRCLSTLRVVIILNPRCSAIFDQKVGVAGGKLFLD